MATLDGAQILVRQLKAEGVEVIFTLTGGHIFRVYQEAQKLGIRVVDFRHEGAAAYAAMGYAIITGKPGVVLLTAGPGVTNAVTQVCDSMLGDVPVLFLGGASATQHDLTEVLQEYDCLTLMKNNTLWSFEVQDTARIAEATAVAFRHMLGAHTGPVYLELPMDVLEMNRVEEGEVVFPENYRTQSRVFGDPAAIAKAGDLLIAAERPAIIIGDGAQYNCQNPGVFRELAEYLQIPVEVSVTNGGRFFNEEESPLFQLGAFASGSSDVLMVMNHKLNHSAVQNVNPASKLINVHRNHRHVGLNAPMEVGIIGYADAVAEQLLAYIQSKTPPVKERKWIAETLAMKQAVASQMKALFESDADPIHPARVAGEINTFLKSDEGRKWCYWADGGDSVTWALTASAILGLPKPFVGRAVLASYIGCVGASWGMISGLYAAAGKPVLHSIGDGSFGQYVGELFTFAKFKIPYVCVIFNDRNWGMIKAFSMHDVPEEDHEVGSYIALENQQSLEGFFHYEEIAKVFDGFGVCVHHPDEIYPAIVKAAEAAKKGVPAIV
ncbi:MAG: thiamine pyrophosphate-binding protein, partial [Clostridiales bacterium]|nr:thiamine pyrophosphate-binding protein [Clostridiales bacterium]